MKDINKMLISALSAFVIKCCGVEIALFSKGTDIMALSEKEHHELLAFNTGKPIIITPTNALSEFFEYDVVIYVRTISSSTPNFIRAVQLKMKFSSTYPAAPPLVCLFRTALFHPNFSVDGNWCGNVIEENESLSDYMLRLVRVIQFKEINPEQIANRNAMAWYNRMKDSELFPTGNINYNAKPRISIIKINDVAN